MFRNTGASVLRKLCPVAPGSQILLLGLWICPLLDDGQVMFIWEIFQDIQEDSNSVLGDWKNSENSIWSCQL